jgi:tetratricopeptide (TPR) repeat protein
MPGMRENTIVLRDVRGMNEASIIMHEYVHFLVRNHGSLQYPKWYDEGFAEYLSAARVQRKNFEIGLVPEGRMNSLQYSIWIPIRQIISPEGYDKWSRERQAMFYAEAWALVHYLQNQPDRQNSFIEDMLQYIDFIESGKGDIESFEEAFGISAKNLNKEVKRYLKKGQFTYFKIDADQLLPTFNPTVTRLTKEQASLALGQLALRNGKLDKAEHLFSIASVDGPTQPRAVAGLGDTLKFRGDFEAALPYFKRAVALAPEDPYCQLDLAEYWHDLSTRTEEADERSEHLKSAREHYMAAWQLDESAPETYAMYGKTFLDEGYRYDKAIEMLEEAQNLLPSSLDIRLMLAKAYLEVDRLEDAIEATLSVLAWSHSESGTAKQAQDLLIRLKSELEKMKL